MEAAKHRRQAPTEGAAIASPQRSLACEELNPRNETWPIPMRLNCSRGVRRRCAENEKYCEDVVIDRATVLHGRRQIDCDTSTMWFSISAPDFCSMAAQIWMKSKDRSVSNPVHAPFHGAASNSMPAFSRNCLCDSCHFFCQGFCRVALPQRISAITCDKRGREGLLDGIIAN